MAKVDKRSWKRNKFSLSYYLLLFYPKEIMLWINEKITKKPISSLTIS